MDPLWLEKEQPALFKQMIALNPKNIIPIKGSSGNILNFEIISLDGKEFKGYKEGGLEVVTVNWDVVDLKWLEANQNQTYLKYMEAKRLFIEQEKNGPFPQAITLVKSYLGGLNARNPDLMQILTDGTIDPGENVRDFFYYDRLGTGFTGYASSVITAIETIPNWEKSDEVKRLKTHLGVIVEFSPKLFTRLKTNSGTYLKASLDSNARFKVKFALDALAGMVKSYESSSKKE